MSENLDEKKGPLTLSIDIGGTGLKAALLDAEGNMVSERVHVHTPYPLSPEKMVDTLADLVSPLSGYERVSAGFPGVVRSGIVITAPHFITAKGPGTATVPELEKAWARFALADKLAQRLGKPVKLANDADLQGMAVVQGKGLEVVLTLGTGFGSAVFLDGRLGPHIELAHHRFRKGQTYNEQLGEAALEKIGVKKWNKRLAKALVNMRVLFNFDHCYLGGGNSRHVCLELEDDVSLVDNSAGIIGGIRLWEEGRHLT